jgi:hypothetical protein
MGVTGVYIPPTTPNPSPQAKPGAALPPSSGQSFHPTKAPPAQQPATTQLTFNDIYPVYDQATKQWRTAYVEPATGKERFAAILADPNSSTGYVISTDEVAVRGNVIQGLVNQYGSLAKAKEALWEKGLYSGSGAKSKASISFGNDVDPIFSGVVDTLIGTISHTNWYNKGKDVQDVSSFVYGRPNYAGTKNTQTVNYTSKDAAWSDLDSFMRTTVGRVATVDEFNNYYSMLTTYEKTHPTRATVTTDALGVERNRVQIDGASPEDKKAILVAAVTPALEAIGKDPVAISKVGGTIATNMQKLKTRAAEMGVSDIYDESKAFAGAVESVQQGADVQNEINKINALAKAQPKYKTYAAAFDAGFTLQDLANPGQKTANKLLGRSDAVNVNSPLMQAYLTKGAGGGQMSDDEFNKFIKKDPVYGKIWAVSPDAKDEASQYATNILKQFGFLG